MRRALIILVFFSLSCNRQIDDSKVEQVNTALSNNIPFSTVELDTIALQQFIIRNDKLLDIFRIELKDKEKAERINDLIQSDSNRMSLYKTCKFQVKEDKRCKGYRHLIISKERQQKGYDLEPYKGLFLIIVDPFDKVILTEKLEEKSRTLQMTSSTDETSWHLKPDSLLAIQSESNYCIDIITEGQGMTCWTEKKRKLYKLKCNGLELIEKDSIRTETSN